MFIEILKEAFSLFRKNSNLSQLIFIFFLLMNMLLPILFDNKINLKFIPIIGLFFAFLSAFFAGLFFAFKKAIDYETNPPQKDNDFGLPPLYFAEFFQGIGLHIKKFLAGGGIFLLLLIAFMLFFNYVITHFVVIPPELMQADFKELASNDTLMMNFVNNLSPETQLKISKISLFSMLIFSLFGIVTMLYPVVLVKSEENFIRAFFISIKFLFKNIIVSIIIFAFFNICLALTSMLTLGTNGNIFIFFISLLLQCYLNTWYIFSLFVYYEKVK